MTARRPRPPATADTPYLLTPGPLTTSLATKEAMLRDWGSRDGAFLALNARVRERLVEIAGGAGSHVAVPLQGSGTFAVEAMLGSLVPPSGRLLLLINGAYGRRMARICTRIGRDAVTLETAEDTPPAPAAVGRWLADDPEISHVAMVHCETSSGILNPLAEIAAVAAEADRRLLVDAMSAFGAIELDVGALPCDAVVASANKCLEGVPGMAFAVVRRALIESSAGNAPSLALDLHDQWRAMEDNGQWRFTPPTHVIAALDQALAEHAAEGGVAGRGGRYRRNCEALVAGMRALGFETFLPDALQAPVIVAFHAPADPSFDFRAFYDGLARRGYVVYPGKLTEAETFRIGCMGRIDEEVIEGAVAAVAEVLDEMGVKNRGRKAA